MLLTLGNFIPNDLIFQKELLIFWQEKKKVMLFERFYEELDEIWREWIRHAILMESLTNRGG